MAETTDFITLTGGATLFVLASAPGKETMCRGTLIAEAWARGRPPFGAILTEVVPDAGARQAIAILGVPPDWVLLLGLPRAPLAEAVASASGVGLLTYRTTGAPCLTLHARRLAACRLAALAHLSLPAHMASVAFA